MIENFPEWLSRLTLGRHGNAKKKADGQNDKDRGLTATGYSQAERLRGQTSVSTADLVISSPADRAFETAVTTTQFSPEAIVVMQELFPSEDPADPLNVMFCELGYAPLNSYFQHELGKHLTLWAIETAPKLLKLMEEKSRELDGKKIEVFVFGHAVMQNALVWALAQALYSMNYSEAELIEQMAGTVVLKEAEALQLVFEGRTACLRHIREDLVVVSTKSKHAEYVPAPQ
jgi:hypothetical protein